MRIGLIPLVNEVQRSGNDEEAFTSAADLLEGVRRVLLAIPSDDAAGGSNAAEAHLAFALSHIEQAADHLKSCSGSIKHTTPFF
jgi:hypothetical protein